MIPLANEPDENEDGHVDDDLGEIVVNDRTCIVTREAGSPETLIRFVAGPNGQVVPDLKRQLPGRGCWIKAERSLVERAVQKSFSPGPSKPRRRRMRIWARWWIACSPPISSA